MLINTGVEKNVLQTLKKPNIVLFSHATYTCESPLGITTKETPYRNNVKKIEESVMFHEQNGSNKHLM